MLLVLATAAALAPLPPRTALAAYDLPPPSRAAADRDQFGPMAPPNPHNLDTRDLTAPEFAMELAERGPVILVGAMGGRHRGTYKDIPKLAHVALGWSF